MLKCLAFSPSIEQVLFADASAVSGKQGRIFDSRRSIHGRCSPLQTGL